MIVMDRNTKDLVIPKSLGNFGGGSEGGGVTPEDVEQIASAITENAIDEYDTELQVDLEEIRDAVSANTQSIEELSGLTDDVAAISAATSANTEAVEALSGVPADIESLSSQTDYLSSRMASLIPAVAGISGQTSANTEAIEVISAQTSANTANIEAISGAVKEDVILDVSVLTGMTTEQKQQVWLETESKYLAGHKIYLKGNNVGTNVVTLPLVKYVPHTEGGTDGYLDFVAKDGSLNTFFDVNFFFNGNINGLSGGRINTSTIYRLPTASATVTGGVKIGSGITVDGNGVISVEGGSSTPSYIINDVLTGTTQDIIDFYNIMLPMVSGSSFEGVNVYYRSRALNMTDNLSVCTNAWYQSAQDFGIDSVVFRFDIENYAKMLGETLPDMINIVIKSDGTVETYSAAGNVIPSTTCVYVGPNGEFWGHRSAEFLYDEGQQLRLAVKGCEGDFSAEYGFGSIVYARKVTVSDVTTYTWSLIVPTDTGVMKGVWHTTDLYDTTNYVLDSWTAL